MKVTVDKIKKAITKSKMERLLGPEEWTIYLSDNVHKNSTYMVLVPRPESLSKNDIS